MDEEHDGKCRPCDRYSAQLGNLLRASRKRAGLTLQDVAVISAGEFRPSVVGAYERCERKISAARMVHLLEIYGVDLHLPRLSIGASRARLGEADLAGARVAQDMAIGQADAVIDLTSRETARQVQESYEVAGDDARPVVLLTVVDKGVTASAGLETWAGLLDTPPSEVPQHLAAHGLDALGVTAPNEAEAP